MKYLEAEISWVHNTAEMYLVYHDICDLYQYLPTLTPRTCFYFPQGNLYRVCARDFLFVLKQYTRSKMPITVFLSYLTTRQTGTISIALILQKDVELTTPHVFHFPFVSRVRNCLDTVNLSRPFYNLQFLHSRARNNQ